MKKLHDRQQQIKNLKKRAEDIIDNEQSDISISNEWLLDDINQDNIKTLVHNLKVHQIELEMQNEELFNTQKLLEKSRDEYQSLYHNSPVSYCTINRDGIIIRANATFSNVLSVSSDKIIGQAFVSFIEDEYKVEFRARFKALFNKPENKELDFQLITKDKPHVVLTAHEHYVKPPKGETERHLQIALTDITTIKKNEIELMLASQVFEHCNEGIIVTDKAGRIVRVNKSFTIVTGYSEYEAIGQSPSFLQSGKHNNTFYNDMWKNLKNNNSWQGEIANKRKNGEIYIEWLSISAVKDSRGIITNYVGIFSDITEKKLNSEKVHQLAYYDLLTGLPNRTLFYDRLKQALIRAQRAESSAGVLFLDLDNFKELNDRHGHAAGDMLLRQVADRLSSVIRKSDTIARLGGDEFTVIVPDIDSGADSQILTASIAEKIIQEVSKPYELDNIQYSVSASIGIAIYPQDGDCLSELLKHADTAMYQAKAAGKNTFQFFSQKVFEAQKEVFDLKKQLSNALDNNEFELYYQPQLLLKDKKLKGFEALIRWNHPEKGLLPPGYFIVLAEETGMIVDIGLWVLEEAIKQHRKWSGEGHTELTISVNLSIEQLRDPLLSQNIQELLDKHSMPPELLILEVTETVMLKDTLEVSAPLKQIKSLGIKISLDDFGTGYSTMKYVKHFPLDSLKIDKSFVGDIFESIEDRSIVLASLSLAKNLKLETVGEGIEELNQEEFLIEHGCSLGQGYLYSKPLPVKKASQFIKESMCVL